MRHKGGHPTTVWAVVGGKGRRRPAGSGTRQRVPGGQLPCPGPPRAPWLERGQTRSPDSSLAASCSSLGQTVGHRGASRALEEGGRGLTASGSLSPGLETDRIRFQSQLSS